MSRVNVVTITEEDSELALPDGSVLVIVKMTVNGGPPFAAISYEPGGDPRQRIAAWSSIARYLVDHLPAVKS